MTGLVKGWAASQVSAGLSRAGVPDHLVNAAGDIVLAGRPDGRVTTSPWQVGLSDPHRPGTVLGSGPTISKLADMPEVKRASTPREAVERVQADLREFRDRNNLDQVVVANVSSTEAPRWLDDRYSSVAKFRAALDAKDTSIPASARSKVTKASLPPAARRWIASAKSAPAR